jgi:heme/copper-type cytochrome/quinol oxidase subunit 2
LAAELAQRSHGLHAALLAVCASLAVVLFAALLYSIMSARMRHAGHETPAMRKPRPIKEALWALIPIAIVIGAAAPAVRVYLSDTGATASASSTGGNAAFQCRLAGARGTE